MRALLERFRPGSGITGTTSVSGEWEADVKPEEARRLVYRLKALITLFIWLVTLLLSCLGSVSLRQEALTGELFLYGSLVLTLGALVLINQSKSPLLSLAIPFVCFLMVAIFPQLMNQGFQSDRNVSYDLYFVVLIAVPAFMDLWSWRIQALLGVLGVLSVTSGALIRGGNFPVSSFLLISTAALLSSFTRFIQQREVSEQIQRWRSLASRLLDQVSVKQFPQQVWNLMLFESALLVCLLFFDISTGANEFSSALQTKLYGIAIAVLGGSLVVVLPPKRMAKATLLGATLIGFVLSLSRIGSPESGAYAALPIVALFLATSFLHWTIEHQLQFVWAVIVGDLLIKLAFIRNSRIGATMSEASTEALLAYRSELAALVIGGALSIFLISSIRRYRYSQLSQFANLYDLGGTGVATTSTSLRMHRLAKPCNDRIQPERNRSLFFGLFCSGIISSAASSRLIELRSDFLGWIAVLTWVVFLLSWAALVYQERRNPKWSRLWTLGASLNLLLLLWPTLLLTSSPSFGFYWLVWPLMLCVGVGFVPWNVYQLVPLLMISAGLGVELSYKLGFGIEENSILIGSGVLSALLSVQAARRLREKFLFVNFHQALDEALTDKEVLRVLGDYLQHLFGAEAVFLSSNEEHLELLQDGQSVSLLPSAWPLRELNKSTSNEFQATKLRVLPINWLGGRFGFFDNDFGVVSPNSGVMVELGDETSAGPNEGGFKSTLFVSTPFPVFRSVRAQELVLTEMLGAVARLKLASYARAKIEVELLQTIEAQSAQREYELNTLVHDINNTVQDLTLLCELILEDFVNEHREESVDGSMVERVKRIATIARSVATVISDAKRRRELEKTLDLTPRELVELNEVIRELVQFSSVRAERKRISIDVSGIPEGRLYVLVSVKEHLETILRNILNNAILYSKPGSRIEVQVRAEENQVCIEVRDDGPGLSEEECESVFSAGYRGKAASVHGGLGLGLAESRRVARAAGGEITASSPGLGLGATFIVSLPRQKDPAVFQGNQSWALLVDDQPNLTDFYARVARAMNLEAEVASSVSEALQIVAERGRPRVVMTDIHLGESDGLDLVQQLRENFGPQLPIVVISGLNSEEVMRRVRAVGATDFVAKPVGRRALFARIQSLISEGE